MLILSCFFFSSQYLWNKRHQNLFPSFLPSFHLLHLPITFFLSFFPFFLPTFFISLDWIFDWPLLFSFEQFKATSLDLPKRVYSDGSSILHYGPTSIIFAPSSLLATHILNSISFSFSNLLNLEFWASTNITATTHFWILFPISKSSKSSQKILKPQTDVIFCSHAMPGKMIIYVWISCISLPLQLHISCKSFIVL